MTLILLVMTLVVDFHKLIVNW